MLGIWQSTALELGEHRDTSSQLQHNGSNLRGYKIPNNSARVNQYKTASEESNIHRRWLQPGRREPAPPPPEQNEPLSIPAYDTTNTNDNSPSINTAAAGENYGTYMNGGSSNTNDDLYSGISNYGSSGSITSTSAGESAGSSTYGTYGSSGSTYGASSGSTYGSDSSYGSGSTYGASSGSSYGSASSYGSDSYSSQWGTGAASSQWGTSQSSKSKLSVPTVNISLFLALFLAVIIALAGMLVTAHQMEHDPEGTYANCCRVSLHTVNCIYKVVYNLYHCRLGEIPQVVLASELEEDEYTDEEIERMRLRPGIERALDVEHRKALRKVGIEMNKIKVNKKGSAEKNGGSRNIT